MCSGWLKDSVVESIACSGAASPQWLPRPLQFHTPSRLLPASGGVRQSTGNFGSGVVMGISIKGLCRYLSFSLSLVWAQPLPCFFSENCLYVNLAYLTCINNVLSGLSGNDQK